MRKQNFKREDFAADSEILYADYSQKSCFPIVELIAFVIVVMISVVIDGFMIGSIAMTAIMNETPGTKAIVYIVAFLVHAVPQVVWALKIFKKIIYRKNTYYIVTDSKLVVIYDLEVVECKIINFEKLVSINQKGDSLIIVVNEEKEKLYGITLSEEILNRIAEKNNLHNQKAAL